MRYGQPSRFSVFLAVVVSAVPASLLVLWVALTILDRMTRQPPRQHLLDDF